MKMRKCPVCGRYTFKAVCPLCKVNTILPEPPRYSPEDKYGKYRRILKFGN